MHPTPSPRPPLPFEQREKELEPLVRRAVDEVRSAIAHRAPALSGAFFYGAVGVDPRHLVVWYLFATDRQKEAAAANGLRLELDRCTRAALRDAGYPAAALTLIHVSFASDEEINRAGGWAFFR